MQALARRVAELTPADLPGAPWVFREAPFQYIGHSYTLGGPYTRVIDNEKFLAALRIDIAQGARSPRAKTGALQADLVLLCWILDQRVASGPDTGG